MALEPWQQEFLDSLREEMPPLTTEQVRSVVACFFFNERRDQGVMQAFMHDDDDKLFRLFVLGRIEQKIVYASVAASAADGPDANTGEHDTALPIHGHPDLADLADRLRRSDSDDLPDLARHHVLSRAAIHNAIQRLAASAEPAQLSLLVQTYSILVRIEEGLADDTDLDSDSDSDSE